MLRVRSAARSLSVTTAPLSPWFAPSDLPRPANFPALSGVQPRVAPAGFRSKGVKCFIGPSPPCARNPRKRGWPMHPMKKLCLILVAFVLSIFTGLPALVAAQVAAPASTASASVPAPAPPAPASNGQVVEEIITRVNNQIITRSEYDRSKDQLRDEVKQQNSKDPDAVYAEREKDVLRDLIDQQLLIDKGKDLGILGDTELIKQLDQMRKDMKLDSLEDLEKEATKQGISWEDFKQTQRNQIITRRVIGEEVSAHLSVTKDEQQKFYDEHKSEMEQPEFIRLSEILVAPKAAAAPATPDPAAPATASTTAPPAVDDAALSAAEAKANDLLKQIRG